MIVEWIKNHTHGFVSAEIINHDAFCLTTSVTVVSSDALAYVNYGPIHKVLFWIGNHIFICDLKTLKHISRKDKQKYVHVYLFIHHHNFCF